VTVSGLAISGTDAGNYSLTQPATTADITAKGLTVSGVTAPNRAFNGTTTVALDTSAAALVGIVSATRSRSTRAPRQARSPQPMSAPARP